MSRECLEAARLASQTLCSLQKRHFIRAKHGRGLSQRGFSRQPGLFPVSVTSVVLAEMLSCVSR